MLKVKYLLTCVALWAGVFSLQGCSVANSLRLMNANNAAEFDWQASGHVNPVTASYEGEKVYVLGSINGVEGFKFLVDTGAAFTILTDTHKVKALQLEPGYDLSLSGWGEEQDSKAYQTSLKQLTLGQMSINDIDVAYMPVSTSPYYSRPDEAIYDGVIGHDLLSKLNWQFDRQQNRVVALNQSYQPVSGELSLPLDIFMSKISVDIEVDFGNGQVNREQVILDTGSRHYFKLGSAYISGRDISLPGSSITAADFGVSGKTEHQRVTLPAITLDSYRLEKVKTNIIPSEDEDDWWVLGNALLNQFVMSIDYAKQTLYLRPYAGQPFRSRYNLMGLELRKLASGNFVLRYVFPGLPGEVAGLKAGDEITSINSKAAKDISMLEWLKLTNTEGEYQLCRLQATCVNLSSKQIAGYSM